MVKGSDISNHWLTLVFVSLLVLSLLVVAGNKEVFAMGYAPSTCTNEYNGPITSFIINNGTQTFDVMSNPGVTPNVNQNSTYTVTFVIHTYNTSSNGNTNLGTTWYAENNYGYYAGHCVPDPTTTTIGPNENVTAGKNLYDPTNLFPGTGKQYVTFQTIVNSVSYSVNWRPVPQTVPSAPTALEASPVSSSQINLSWTAPANNGGSYIQAYKIERSTDGGVTWSTIVSRTTYSYPPYSDVGLAASTTYTYRVSAINSYGTSYPSNAASATTQATTNQATTATIPQPPTGLTATAGNGKVSLSWSAPSNGGSAITYYKIYRSTSSGTEVYLTTRGNVTSWTDTGVTFGNTYFYKVSALNSAGISPQSNEASAAPYTLPSSPQNLQATGGNARVSLSWQAPSSNGGSAITYYKIYRSTSSGAEVYLTTRGNVTSWTDTGVTFGNTYFYKVSAVNSAGISPQSNEASATPSANPPTGTHTFLNDTFDTNISGWQPYGATGYHLALDSTTGVPSPSAHISGDAWFGNCSKHGMYKVVDISSYTGGPVMLAFNWRASSAGETQAEVRVDNADTGTPLLIYRLANSGVSDTGWQHYSNDISNLISGQQRLQIDLYLYDCWAANYNENNWYDNISLAWNTSSPSPPNAPTGLSATAVSSSQINLSWNAPGNNGGSAITGYKIDRSADYGVTWGTIVPNTNSVSTTYPDTGLASATAYTYRVFAINSIGTGPQSNTATDGTYSANGAPSTPTGTNATLSTPSTIKLSWNLPVSSGSSQVTGYKIEKSTDNGSTWDIVVSNTGNTATIYFDTVRSPGTTYTYRISAINSAGNSLPSSPVSVTTPAISVTAAFETCCYGGMQINGFTQPMPGFDQMRLLLHAPNGNLVINGTVSAGGFQSSYFISRGDGKGNYNITLTYDKLSSTYLLPSFINNDPTIYLTASESWSSSGDVYIHAQVSNDITGEYVSVAIKNSTNATIASYSQSTSLHGMAEFYIDPASAKQIFTKSGNYTIVATHVPTGAKAQTVLAYTTSTTVPQPPTGLAANTVSSSQINLSWSAPTNNGGSAITGYEIERSNDTGSTWNIIVSNTGNTVPTFSDTGLAPSTSYTYRVSAINSAGTSSPSNTTSATTSPSSTPSTAIITVKAVDSSGTVLHMYTLLKTSAGVTLTTGFTPVGFTVNTNTDYLVKVSNYSTHTFQHWQDQPSNTNQVRPINISQNTTIVAVFS